MSALVLTGAIPGLMRRGSPAWWRDEETPYVVTMTYTDADEAVWMVGAPCLGIPIGVQDEPSNFVLDLTDPTGRYHALLWLRERGHDLRWAEDEAEVLAWSVLSVARGGKPIAAILPTWRECGGQEWMRDGRHDTAVVERGVCAGWTLRRFSKNPINGPETGHEGRAAADRAALAAGYALRNEDGTLTMPTPLEVPHVE